MERTAMKVYQFTVVIEPDEDAFHAYVPVLPGCHTFGATVEEAQANIKEAIALHIESMLEDDEPLPVEREPVFITRLSIPVAA
jgi:predicted RNase H-like HicB family nuclease